MVDDHVRLAHGEALVVVGLRVHHHQLGEVVPLKIVDMFDVDPQQADHGDVVRAVDHVDAGDPDAGHLAPEEAFDGHGAGDGVGVGVDHHEHLVITGELLVEEVQFFLGGGGHPYSFRGESARISVRFRKTAAMPIL